MCKQVPWNRVLIDEFVRLGNLNDEEIYIIESRSKSVSIIEQSLHLGVSESTVNRMTQRLKQKYDNVQKLSDILPPRKFSVKETYN